MNFDLLHGFLIYISITFVINLALRVRLYAALYVIANHVRWECPAVYRLLHEHWMLCVRNGIIPMLALYVALMAAYMALNRFVWPLASVSVADLARLGPSILPLELGLVGLMVAFDLLLIGQTSKVDAERVIADLSYAEGWLGGNLNNLLQFLGKWNPIMRFANQKAQENSLWFNGMFRNSLAALIVALGLRLATAISLFACYVEFKL